jgi:diguanylate cyclase (GGDEF)-like protein
LVLLLSLTAGPAYSVTADENTPLAAFETAELNNALLFASEQETQSPQKVLDQLLPLLQDIDRLSPAQSQQLHLQLTKSYYRLQRFNEALKASEPNLPGEDVEMPSGLQLETMIFRAAALTMTSELDEAKQTITRVLSITDTPELVQWHIQGLITMAKLKIEQMEYDAAMLDLNTAKRLISDPMSKIESPKKRLLISGNVYHCLAALYEILQQEEKMLEALRKTLGIDRQLNAQIFIAQDLLKLAKLAQSKGDLVSAERDLQEAIEISRNNVHIQTLFLGLSHLSDIFTARGALEEARASLDEARQHYDSIRTNSAKGYYILANARLMHATGNSERALSYIKQHQPMFDEKMPFESVQALMELKASIYASTQQFALAYKTNRELYEKFRANREKAHDKIIDSIKVSNQLQRKDIENQLLLKDNALRRAELEQLIQSNTEQNYWATAFSMLAAAVIGLCIYRLYQWMRLKSIANRDQLTGVFNRQYVFEKYVGKIESHINRGHPVAAMLISIDFFKLINDQLGHLAGDRVLEEVAKACQSCLRGKGIVARLGGKEFIALLPRASEQEVNAMAAAIQLKLQKIQIEGMGPDRTISASMGIVFTDREVCSLTRLIDAAQDAVAETKVIEREEIKRSSDNIVSLRAAN